MVSRSELLDLVLQVFEVLFIRQPPLQIIEESFMLDLGISAKTPLVGISVGLAHGDPPKFVPFVIPSAFATSVGQCRLLQNLVSALLRACSGKSQGGSALSARVVGIHKGQGRPVSRILLYPAIHLRGIPGLPEGSRAYQPDAVRPNNLACSHRWFTWPAPYGIPPVGSYPTLSPITCDRVAPIHRLVCSLLHLT